MPISEAVCPAGISSFFEVCNTDAAGNPLTDPARIGARGGGFGIGRGVSAKVDVRIASETRITIRINSKPAPEAHTTRWAIDELLKSRGIALDVQVDIKVYVPVAAGFGTSAAGTLASCVALVDAADIPMTLNDLGRSTHIAEIVNRTGLGTASALLIGGFVLVTEPGAPGIGLIDRLFFPQDHSIVSAYLGPISTQETLTHSNVANRVNPAARRAMEAIRKTPRLSTFLDEARRFSQESGFQTRDISRLIETMASAGAVGATQNMVGRAVHGVAEDAKVPRVLKALKNAFPAAKILVSQLDDRGVCLVSRGNTKH